MEIGDMVRLTSGGPKMVVTLARNAYADTAWFDGDRLQRGELLPLDTLELVDEEADEVNPQSPVGEPAYVKGYADGRGEVIGLVKEFHRRSSTEPYQKAYKTLLGVLLPGESPW